MRKAIVAGLSSADTAGLLPIVREAIEGYRDVLA
jgi:hypothetical protein